MRDFAEVREEVDVCIVVEGCYPFIAGGVSSWLDWLMRNQPDLRFGVVALVADDKPRQPKYEAPDNLAYVDTLPLSRTPRKPGHRQPGLDHEMLADNMCALIGEGDLDAFAQIMAIAENPVRREPFGWISAPTPPTYDELLGAQVCWRAMVECYRRLCPTASFPDFFWAWRHLTGGMFATLTFPVPPAKVYHAISTGYAGLFAARAALATGGKSIVTEHGIYCNERRIDLIVADWLKDTLPADLSCSDPRRDVRRLWVEAFEAFARIAYRASDRITTLYGANQIIQTSLGAEEEKLRVIPNGIDLERFGSLAAPSGDRRPTVALIGRVVPIKDIESFIAAAAEIRRAVPDAEVLVIGPTDEDEDYFALCQRQVADLGLEGCVRFTGKMNIADILPSIDVMVLSSISEAQPLVILEAGAARIACVATDVGSCREIIEGTADEVPALGSGGRVVPPMDSSALAAAVVELLADGELRAACGNALRRRVETQFTSALSAERYRDLYREMGTA